MTAVKRILKILLIIVLVLAFVVGGYLAYMLGTYYRIDDHFAVEIENNQAPTLELGKEYTAATYNIGFGAYTPDYTFFMDEGIMEDGTHKVGAHSVAASEESVRACTQGSIDLIREINPDFALFQEVDTKSTRSYNVDQKAAIEDAFPNMGSAFAVNFHSSFLAYPIPEMHGIVNAGLLSLSDTRVQSAVRRSFPVDDGFPTKFFDLDRCFLIERIPVSNGADLVLINNHMSAYDEGGKIRAQQLELLTGVMKSEAHALNIDAGFKYSDHNPVLLTFRLLPPTAEQGA